MQKDQMIFAHQGCQPNSFSKEKEVDRYQNKDFDKMMQKQQDKYGEDEQDRHQNQFGYEYGYRFDGANHNWVIMNSYLNMSQSFMCFVIQDKIKNFDNETTKDEFDSTAFNYIFNKSTAFISLTFLLDNHFLLEEVLENMHQDNPNLLELIKYANVFKDGEKIVWTSPLHRSLSNGLNRQTDALLRYQGISINNSNNMSIYQQQIMD